MSYSSNGSLSSRCSCTVAVGTRRKRSARATEDGQWAFLQPLGLWRRRTATIRTCKLSLRIVEPERSVEVSWALLDLRAIVSEPRGPRYGSCPVRWGCRWAAEYSN